jgi:hypothetical protein
MALEEFATLVHSQCLIDLGIVRIHHSMMIIYRGMEPCHPKLLPDLGLVFHLLCHVQFLPLVKPIVPA